MTESNPQHDATTPRADRRGPTSSSDEIVTKLAPGHWRISLRATWDGYKEFVLDQLSELNGLNCRAMFGGYGLSLHGKFFGIIHKGRLYFRTDTATVPRYLAQQMKPFRPNARQTLKNYYEVPVGIVESAESLVEWARTAACR
jgi:DNA transformation protein and related proteins